MNDDREFMEALKAFESGSGEAAAADDAQSSGGDGGSGFEAAQSMAGGDDREFFQALAAFGGGGGGAGVAAAGSAEALSLSQVCSTYKTVKPIISGVLGFIQVIPGIGAATATAVRALMAVLDKVCGGSGTLAQLCQIWKQVRPIVLKVISIVAKIPFIGGKAAKAIQSLANVLNGLCP